MKRLRIPWLPVLISSYGLATSLWIGLWLGYGDQGWLLILLNHFGSLPPLLAFPLLILVLWRRRWLLLPPLAPVLIFYAALFGPYYVPRLAPSTSPPELTMMSYNVLYANQNHRAIADLIRTYAPDFVALQEVGPELFAFLQKELGAQYPAMHKAHDPDHSTTALLSRYPVQRFQVVDLGAIRPAVIADLTVAGQTVTVVSAHLLYYGWLRIPWTALPAQLTQVQQLQVQQAQRLLAELRRHQSDIILMGCDCNSVDTSTTQRLLNRQLTNAAKTTGWVLPQLDKPAIGPFYFPHRIDYIFYRGKVIARKVYTIYDSGGSDHRPVWAAFDFGQANE